MRDKLRENNFDDCFKAKKFNLCPDVGQFGRYFAKTCCEKAGQNGLLRVARENPRLKNSYIYAKIRLLHQKLKKLESYIIFAL